MGAFFEFTEEDHAFPFKVYGKKCPDNPRKNRDRQNGSSSDEKSDAPNKSITNENNTRIIPLNIDRSSQFLSALLLCGPMVEEGFRVKLTGKRQARSYVEISEKMMKAFGYEADETGIKTGDKDVYEILPDRGYEGREYDIEPDVSAACYFYALAAINGGKTCVVGVHPDSTQGDLRFLDVLEKMGCKVYDEKAGMIVEKEPENKLHGIEINMSDFSDQTMTLAAIAPFTDAPVKVTGVSHIRGQESDRISAIVTELNRIGVRVEEYEDGFKVWPYESDRVSNPDYGATLTYNDHRMAMSFATLGTGIDGVFVRGEEKAVVHAGGGEGVRCFLLGVTQLLQLILIQAFAPVQLFAPGEIVQPAVKTGGNQRMGRFSQEQVGTEDGGDHGLAEGQVVIEIILQGADPVLERTGEGPFRHIPVFLQGFHLRLGKEQAPEREQDDQEEGGQGDGHDNAFAFHRSAASSQNRK